MFFSALTVNGTMATLAGSSDPKPAPAWASTLTKASKASNFDFVPDVAFMKNPLILDLDSLSTSKRSKPIPISISMIARHKGVCSSFSNDLPGTAKGGGRHAAALL
jgi:hypothetical protein